MRDHRKLTAFQKADGLALGLYRSTERLPIDERYALRSQIRRAAVSVSANIVEGCARTTHREYVNHLNIALGSAAELRYLLDLAGRIYPSFAADGNQLPEQAGEVVMVLAGLIDGLRRAAGKTPGTQ